MLHKMITIIVAVDFWRNLPTVCDLAKKSRRDNPEDEQIYFREIYSGVQWFRWTEKKCKKKSKERIYIISPSTSNFFGHRRRLVVFSYFSNHSSIEKRFSACKEISTGKIKSGIILMSDFVEAVTWHSFHKLFRIHFIFIARVLWPVQKIYLPPACLPGYVVGFVTLLWNRKCLAVIFSVFYFHFCPIILPAMP